MIATGNLAIIAILAVGNSALGIKVMRTGMARGLEKPEVLDELPTGFIVATSALILVVSVVGFVGCLAAMVADRLCAAAWGKVDRGLRFALKRWFWGASR